MKVTNLALSLLTVIMAGCATFHQHIEPEDSAETDFIETIYELATGNERNASEVQSMFGITPSEEKMSETNRRIEVSGNKASVVDHLLLIYTDEEKRIVIDLNPKARIQMREITSKFGEQFTDQKYYSSLHMTDGSFIPLVDYKSELKLDHSTLKVGGHNHSEEGFVETVLISFKKNESNQAELTTPVAARPTL